MPDTNTHPEQESLRNKIDESVETLLNHLGQRDDSDNWWGFDTNVGTLEDNIEGATDIILKLISTYTANAVREARQELVYEIMRGQHGHDEVSIVRSLQEDIDSDRIQSLNEAKETIQ